MVLNAVSFRTSLAGAAFVAAFAAMPTAHAGDWYVDAKANCAQGNGSAAKPYCTIAAAITAAIDGDTIHIAPATYVESLTVSESLNLIGTAGAATTILSGSGVSRILNHRGGVSVSLQGLSLRSGAPGIEVIHGGDLTLTDCTVSNCSLATGGAAVTAVDAVIVIERCTFADNKALGGVNATVPGGAIDATRGSLTLLDSTFSRNQAGGVVNKCGQGGAISAFDGTLLIAERCTFNDNACVGGDGGAIALTELSILGVLAAPVDATFSGCTFTGNNSDTNGAAIKARNGTEFKLTDCYFSRNFAYCGGAIDYSLGALVATRPLALTRCKFIGNGGTDHRGNGACGGAVRQRSGDLRLSDCLFEGNFAGEGKRSNGIGGAVAMVDGSALRCRFVGNRAEGSKNLIGGSGGAMEIEGIVTLTDCILERNNATNRLSNFAGDGGAIVASAGSIVTLTRCTIAGNVADTTHGNAKGGGHGGGISIAPTATVSLDHTIVASNVAEVVGNDLHGVASLVDYNCIGDTAKVSFSTTGPNDLLDVDPQFLDPASGAYSLAPSSPCIDSGDPSLQIAGKDVEAFPRTLDGDLDSQLRIDRGGHEFCHVRLAISGSFTPGGTVTVRSDGLAGLGTFLIVGAAEGLLPLNGLGELYIELLQPFTLLPWFALPSSVDVDIDPSLPVPATFYVQEFAYGSGAGNLSNLLRLDFK